MLLTTDQNKIEALIQLLGDDDSKISSIAYQKLVELEDDHRPALQRAANRDDDPMVRIRLRRILDETHLLRLEQQLKQLIYNDGDYFDLETGVFLLSKIESPKLDVATYQAELDRIADHIKLQTLKQTSLKSVLRTINDVLFVEERFKGNRDDYYNPENSYFHYVIDQRAGIPITLSVVYMLIARRLSLPVYGIGLPTHFICKYKRLSGEELFIDVFNKGKLLSRNDCITYLLRNGYSYRPEYFQISPPRAILTRMINNLMLIYQSRNQERKLNIIQRFHQILVPFESWLEEDELFDDDDDLPF